jgi:hypothetical protein
MMRDGVGAMINGALVAHDNALRLAQRSEL